MTFCLKRRQPTTKAVSPYEVFITSKSDGTLSQWVIALYPRLISAGIRKGGDLTFLVEELRSYTTPTAATFQKGGVFMPSTGRRNWRVLIAKHLKAVGLMESEEP